MHRFFMALSRLMAVAGGFVLSLLVAIVVLSIMGREIVSILHGDFFQNNMKGLADWLLALRLPGIWGDISIGPVNGDYELVEAGVAFAIFSFLPLAQITGGHATVDIFTNWMPERVQRILFAVIEITFAVVLIIIAVQLWDGMMSKMNRHQTTFLLQFPVWWAYAASVIGAIGSAVVAVYVAFIRIFEAFSGRVIAPETMGAEH